MSELCSIEPFQCDKCPFLDCYEKGTCYQCKCYLDNDLKLEDHCDYKTAPTNCPLLDGRIISVRVEDDNLVIGMDYQ